MLAAMTVLGREGVTYHRFTGEEGTMAEDRFGGVSEREAIIRSLDDADVDVLVAMKCLDEGVDVPSARLGIILASSGILANSFSGGAACCAGRRAKTSPTSTTLS